MYWLTHMADESGALKLKIIESDERPTDTNVINHGFNRAQEALVLMSHYLRVDENGFVQLNESLLDKPITMLERTLMAYMIDPALLRLRAVSLALSLVALILIMLHLFHAV